MKTPAFSELSARYALAIAAGIMLALSFPFPGMYLLAWFAPGMLLFAAGPHSSALRIGFYGALAHYLISLRWLLEIPMRLHAIASWLLLSGVLALIVGAWCWICWKTFPRKPGVRSTAKEFCQAALARRFVWILFCATAWVAMEMMIARLFTGFPWNLLGISQHKNLWLIQIASITGVYGVSFLVVWVSIAVSATAILLWHKNLSGRAVAAQLAFPLLVLAGVLFFGEASVNQPEPSRGSLRTALIQPSFPQTVIWDSTEKTNRFNTLLELSREALKAEPALLVWPETAMPDFFTRHNLFAIAAVTNLAASHNVWIAFGAHDTRVRQGAGPGHEVDLFNSSFFVNPAGDLAARYHKRRLVLFGEYMPLRDWFPFLKYFRSSGPGLVPGVRAVPFEMNSPQAMMAVMICFEDVFPHLVREYIGVETDFLLNLTNDGWFGASSAQWQHAAAALFRAVEHRLPLVRCTNNGLTCWIDSKGRIHQTRFSAADIYSAGFELAEIPLPPPGERHRTFYTRYGDVFGWTCVFVTLTACIGRLCAGLRRKGAD